jgi:hypothetical protein
MYAWRSCPHRWNDKMKKLTIAISLGLTAVGPALGSPDRLPPQCHNPFLPYPLNELMRKGICNLGCCDAAGIPLPGATEPPLTRPFMSINEIKAKYPCLATKTCTVKQNDEITAAINTGLAWLRASAGAIGAKEGALGAKKSETHRRPPKTQSGSRLDRSGI